MIGPEDERRVEGDVEPHFQTRDRALAAGELGGERIDAIDDRVGRSERQAVVEQRRCEAELAELAVRRSEIVIRRRVRAA